jgi:hypothetical protein
MTYRQATTADIDGILALQAQYLFANLTPEERKAGFVTTPFTSELITEAIGLKGVFIAETTEGGIVAYAYAASWAYFFQWQMFVHMATYLPELTYKGIPLTTENTFQYGPVCVDKPYRGGEVFPKLFETMRLSIKAFYPISLTFINVINDKSYRAHTGKLGWEVLREFDFNGNRYHFLAFDMEKSVL